uniref:Uncharacterized protein n=1 Tax=Palpitomonas bilix TaxID=652834 RepID=A0A7S3G0P4_9EUKA|mmetsp:Transcript_19315/g.49553  ORF Transcript_19315/g.49553 Transcript_19315/m.49553 type:complete len:276 (+) Transcript_19315:139-966(+)
MDITVHEKEIAKSGQTILCHTLNLNLSKHPDWLREEGGIEHKKQHMQKVLAHLDHHLDLTVVHMHKELVREAVAGQGGEGLADMQDSEKEGVHMMEEVEREVAGNVLQPAQVRLPAEREEGLLREQTHLGSGHSELLATQVKASQLFCRTDMLSKKIPRNEIISLKKGGGNKHLFHCSSLLTRNCLLLSLYLGLLGLNLEGSFVKKKKILYYADDVRTKEARLTMAAFSYRRSMARSSAAAMASPATAAPATNPPAGYPQPRLNPHPGPHPPPQP